MLMLQLSSPRVPASMDDAFRGFGVSPGVKCFHCFAEQWFSSSYSATRDERLSEAIVPHSDRVRRDRESVARRITDESCLEGCVALTPGDALSCDRSRFGISLFNSHYGARAARWSNAIHGGCQRNLEQRSYLEPGRHLLQRQRMRANHQRRPVSRARYCS